MVYLASKTPAHCTTEEIAVATKVKQPYPAKILQSLVHAGIVRSQRGIGGGVCLARPCLNRLIVLLTRVSISRGPPCEANFSLTLPARVGVPFPLALWYAPIFARLSRRGEGCMAAGFEHERWIAERILHIEVSAIRKVFELARSIPDPVNLSIGLPDFDVPAPVKAAAHAAIDAGPQRLHRHPGHPRAARQDPGRSRLADSAMPIARS